MRRIAGGHPLRISDISATERQEGDQQAALIPEMLVEGKTTQDGVPRIAYGPLLQWLGGIEVVEYCHLPLQRRGEGLN